MSDVSRLEFAALPSLPGGYVRALFARKPGLAAGATIPRIEARVASVQVDAEGLARYRSVCGFPASGVLPPTYPHVLAAPLHVALLTSRPFPLPAMGIVHVRNTIVQHAAISEGATLSVECFVEGHREARSGIEYDLVTAVRDGDRLAWESVTTILSPVRRKREEGDASRKAVPSSAEEPADPPTVADWAVPADQGRRYASASGDWNPIHLYPLTARLLGFKRPIAHGMWTLARCVASIGEVPADPVRIEVDFRRPLFLPGAVAFAAGTEGGASRFVVRSTRDGKLLLSGTVAPAAPAP